MSINSIPKARHEGQGVTEPTRREHPTAHVESGGKVVHSAAQAIEGFNPNTSPKARVVPGPHNSVTLHQLVGNSANGHASTSAKMPSHPIDPCGDPAGKPTPVCRPSWGMETTPWP